MEKSTFFFFFFNGNRKETLGFLSLRALRLKGLFQLFLNKDIFITYESVGYDELLLSVSLPGSFHDE